MTDDLTKLPEGWKPDTFTHTPGPWEVGQPRTIFPAGNRSLAVAVTERSRREHEANARLIAAAPTMFDYIAARAKAGDEQADQIVESIHAGS